MRGAGPSGFRSPNRKGDHMTATAVRENAAPQTLADVDRMFNQAWETAHAGIDRRKVDAEERREPVDLTPTHRYVFRTKPGGPRKPLIFIDAPESEWELADRDTPKGRGLLRLQTLWEKRHKNDSPEWLETLRQALEDNHGRHNIAFTPIEQNIESWYQTNSEAIAKVIRAYIKGADANARFFYEVFPGREILVGDRRFPDTPVGTSAALLYMAESGGDLKYVQKGTNKPFKVSE